MGFIKVILTKDQERDKRDKKRIRIRKSKYVESDGTHYCTGKFNATVCTESWESLSIFLKVSQKQLLKHHGSWE